MLFMIVAKHTVEMCPRGTMRPYAALNKAVEQLRLIGDTTTAPVMKLSDGVV